MRDAGIIGFVPRGEYSDTETYDFLQFVYYNGSTYVAKKETTGNTPAENNEFWQILASGHVGDYLPITGGTLSNNKGDILYLENSSENAQSVSLRFKIPNHINNFVMVTAFDNGMIELWDSLNNVSLLKSSKDGIFYRGKKLFVEGSSITPTVKETILKTSTKELTVYGINGATETDITDIFNKANTMNEGMRFGVSPTNGMGYIQSQNFELNCALLTEQERKLLQSFAYIRISKSNNSNDYPLLRPEIFNFCTDMWVNGQNGNKQYFVKMQIKSDNTQNYFQYTLPSDFKTDDFSKNILILRTSEWHVATGIDIKNRG